MPDLDFDTSNIEGVEPQELQNLAGMQQFRTSGMAYAAEHASRPATIGLVLSSSPLALLAWIGEKYLEWSDGSSIPLDTVLRITSLYWFMSSISKCIWPYRGLVSAGHGPASKTKPLGYSSFKDISIVPKVWGKKMFPNLVFRKDHDKVSAPRTIVLRWHGLTRGGQGGHFASLEQPEAFLEDIEEFVLQIGPLSEL